MTFQLADGKPIRGDLVAVLDETVPEMGPGVYYVITTAIIMDPMSLRQQLTQFFDDTPGRTRPFHWHREGPKARQRMIDLIVNTGVLAICSYQSAARNKQARARRRLLAVTADRLAHEAIEHLIIESGDESTNQRDQETLLSHFQDRGGVPFAYDWRTKHEKLLWIADAINGTIADHFRGTNSDKMKRLQEDGVLTDEPQYVA